MFGRVRDLKQTITIFEKYGSFLFTNIPLLVLRKNAPSLCQDVLWTLLASIGYRLVSLNYVKALAGRGHAGLLFE